MKGIIVDGCTACMVALARALVWLLPHQRRAPLRPAPADLRASGSWHCMAIRLASGGGRRRPTGGPAAAGCPVRSSGVSEPAATVAQTAVAAVITVTVAIVVVLGSAVTAATAAAIIGRTEALARCLPACSGRD